MGLILAVEAASGDGEGAGVATTMFERPSGTQPPVTLPTLLLTAAPNGDSGGVGAAAAAPQPSSPRRRSMVTVTQPITGKFHRLIAFWILILQLTLSIAQWHRRMSTDAPPSWSIATDLALDRISSISLFYFPNTFNQWV